MAHRHSFSAQEKILAVIAGVLLVVMVVVGYSQAYAQTPQTDDTINQQKQISEQQNYAKNLRREIEDIKKTVKTGLDTSIIEKHIADFDVCLNTRQIGSPEFWNDIQTCYDHSKAAEEELQNNLRPKRQCGDYLSNVKNRRQEYKNNLERQIKDIKRNDKTADTSALEAQLVAITDLLNKLEQMATECKPDVISGGDAGYLQQDIDNAFRDAYDASNEVNQKANEIRQAGENRNDFEKNKKRQCEKDMGREIKNLEKEYARAEKAGTLSDAAKQAFTAAKEHYNAICVIQLGAMQTALDAGDMEAYNDARSEYDNLNRDFWDLLNEARNFINQQQQLKDILRELTQKEKELMKMTKEYERAVKQAGGIGDESVKAILNQYAQLIPQAREAVQADPQSWWSDYQQQLNDLQNEFWNSQQRVQAVGDVQRWMKDLAKEVQFRERDLKNMARDKGLDQSVISALTEILNQMKALVEQARQLLSSDPEAARELLQSMDELRMKWDETSRSMFERKQIAFELGKTKNEVEYAMKRIKEMAKRGKISQNEMQACLNFAEEVRLNIDNAIAGKLENMEEYFEGLEEKAFEVCPVFKEIENAPLPGAAYYKDFIKQNIQGINQDDAAGMLEKVSQDVVSRVLQRLMADPATVQNLMQLAGKDVAARTLESATTFYDEAAQRDLLAKKSEILTLTKQLEELTTQVQIARDKLAELQAVQKEIASYNFYGNAGDQIRGDIEKFIAEAGVKGLSKEQIRAKVEAFKSQAASAIAESRRAKLEAKIIPFEDTDDNEWFTKYVAPLAKLGIVKGKGGGKFDPSAGVTVAEVLTMAFRVSGDSEVAGRSGLCNGKFSGHWGNQFIAWAEEKGLSIVEKCTDVNRPAQRWEVAQVLLEIAGGGPVGFTDEQCFSDVRPADQPVNSVVCRAREAGLMKGTDGKANAYANVIRAEAATMVKQAAEKLFGMQFEAKQAQEQKEEMKPAAPPEEPEFAEEEEGDEF
ncbi:S-layer homology domain-containing protein [Candidatus Peregrinibacteria bacterium]|nr:S-layer homology domain-containing protein [Candidatus Peregrinibacteria bacterium]